MATASTSTSSTSISDALSTRCACVREGDTVLLRLPSKQEKLVKLTSNATVGLGKFGKFPASELVGKPYGVTYEILDKEGGRLQAMSHQAVAEMEDAKNTNQHIEDDAGSIALLGTAQIEALKQSGAAGRDIIAQQIAQHSQFQLKNEFSKDKYLKRKEAKFLKHVTPLPPTSHNMTAHHFHKLPAKIRELRPDSMSQLLSLANVRPGGKYIVVEDCAGLVVGAVLERLGDEGKILAIHDADSPPAFDVLAAMNFPPALVTSLVSTLNWSNMAEDYTPPPLPLSAKDGGTNFRSTHERDKIRRRRELFETLERARAELHQGEFDGLILASQYEPYSIVDALHKYLAGSASIVAYSPFAHVLTEAQNKLRATNYVLHPSITESWMREYQVLPGRTHPMMNMSGSGGFLLHAIRIFDDPTAHAVTASKKRRLDEPAPAPEKPSGSENGAAPVAAPAGGEPEAAAVGVAEPERVAAEASELEKEGEGGERMES